MSLPKRSSYAASTLFLPPDYTAILRFLMIMTFAFLGQFIRTPVRCGRELNPQNIEWFLHLEIIDTTFEKEEIERERNLETG